MKRELYIVQTTYKIIRKYEILADDAEQAKKFVRCDARADCIDIVETFNVDSAFLKESK